MTLNIRKVKTGFTLIVLFISLIIISCDKESDKNQYIPTSDLDDTLIRAADLSFLPGIEAEGTIYYNLNGQQAPAMTILAEAGMNTVRVRLWHKPASMHSDLAEVKTFAAKIKAHGLKLWLSVHYSDTWADPGYQYKPEAWKNLEPAVLNDSIYNYTTRVVRALEPDYIQIGNEINSGFIWPEGHTSNPDQFLKMLASGCKAVRDNSDDCRIILHFAGYDGADDFFNLVRTIDYDLIGISFYPIWHGKNLNLLQSSIRILAVKYNKKLVIAETAYPFTLGWNDWTDNILGDSSQLIPDFPPTPDGQQTFLEKIRRISESKPLLSGFAYWGAEWIAYRGPEAINGSPWENQALFDFNNKALPAISAFSKE